MIYQCYSPSPTKEVWYGCTNLTTSSPPPSRRNSSSDDSKSAGSGLGSRVLAFQLRFDQFPQRPNQMELSFAYRLIGEMSTYGLSVFPERNGLISVANSISRYIGYICRLLEFRPLICITRISVVDTVCSTAEVPRHRIPTPLLYQVPTCRS